MEHTKGWLVAYIVIDLIIALFLSGSALYLIVYLKQPIIGIIYIVFAISFLLGIIKNIAYLRRKQYIDIAVKCKLLQDEIDELYLKQKGEKL